MPDEINLACLLKPSGRPSEFKLSVNKVRDATYIEQNIKSLYPFRRSTAWRSGHARRQK